LRLRSGLALAELSEQGQIQAAQALADGLLESEPFNSGLAVLTFKGRLLADGLVARLWD
jgi:oxygen-independent coproporphyrinogen-3 oxidase